MLSRRMLAASRCLSRSIGQPKLQIAAPFAVQMFSTNLKAKESPKDSSGRPIKTSTRLKRKKSPVSEPADHSVGYNRSRTSYQGELSQLRRQWQLENEEAKRKADDERRLVKERSVAYQAVRLRERNLQATENIKQHRLRQQEIRKRYEERLAQSILKKEKYEQARQQRYKLLMQDLKLESSSWITQSNIDAMITPELFTSPASTGLVTPISHLWKTQVLTFALNRPMSPEVTSRLKLETPEDFLKEEANWKDEDAELLENFLEGFVSTGEERAMLKSVVEEMKGTLMNQDAFAEEINVEDSVDILREMNVSRRLGYEPFVEEEDLASNPSTRYLDDEEILEEEFPLSEADRIDNSDSDAHPAAKDAYEEDISIYLEPKEDTEDLLTVDDDIEPEPVKPAKPVKSVTSKKKKK